MTLRSTMFSNGGKIPDTYTCTGLNVSPPLAWDGAPEETESFAILVEDPDAPSGTFDHWLIYNIPPGADGLRENMPHTAELPDGSMQGRNSTGKTGYSGPCPPSGEHRYVFRLIALNAMLPLRENATKRDFLASAGSHVLSEAHLTGLYSRKAR